MNYSEIKYCDIANGVGVRTTLFVSGCRHHCPFCFNQETWDFAAGKAFTREEGQQVLESLEPAYVRGLTLLGGEPLEPENQPSVLELVRRVREERPGKDVWLYSGFTWEELTQGDGRARTSCIDELLGLVDVLVDGEFVQDLKDISLRFRGSSNQRIIDVVATLDAGEVVLWEDEPVFSTHAW